MDRMESSDRKRSADKAAPREIEESTAAPDPDEAQLGPAVADVNSTGGELSTGVEDVDGWNEEGRDVVADSGRYRDQGMTVRVVVLGGVPDRRRWSWLQRSVQRG